MRLAARRTIGALLVALAPAAAPANAPLPGRHAAQWCVATTTAPADCGPVQVDVRANGALRVRLDDIEYRLQLFSSQVEVVVMHGAMQIDGFRVPYEWVGSTLRFVDAERNAHYEIRFGAARRR